MNKKIKNAESIIYNDIKFRSKLECRIYKSLIGLGVPIFYEKETFNLLNSFYPTVFFQSSFISKNEGKVRSITYTPDFTFYFKNKYIIIECKGYQNDTYPLKRKMFRALLETLPNKDSIMFFEIKNYKECLTLIQILNGLTT